MNIGFMDAISYAATMYGAILGVFTIGLIVLKALDDAENY